MCVCVLCSRKLNSIVISMLKERMYRVGYD